MIQQPSMPASSAKPEILKRFFWLFTLGNALFWAFATPFFFNFHRVDTVEMMLVGKHWLLASEKHPAFQGWVVEILSQLTNGAGFAPYLAAQIAVVLTILAIWMLAKKYLSPQLALVAAITMLTYFYFHYDCTLYNNRTYMRMFWAWSVYGTLRAFETDKLRYWIGTGILLGMGLYCKLTIFLLIIGIVLFMFLDPSVRRYWKTPGPYITAGICLLLFAPLLCWLVRHHFSVVCNVGTSLGTDRMETIPVWGHVTWPLRFVLSQCLMLLPMTAALVPVLGVGWKWNKNRIWKEDMKSRYLTFMIFFPFAVMTLILIVTGCKIRGAQGCVLWLFFTIFLLYTAARVREDWLAVRRCVSLTGSMLLLFAALSVLIVYYGPKWTGHASRMHYPAQKIAEEVTQVWESRFHTPLAYVRGDDWPAMAVVLYGETRPDEFSPLWMDEDEFQRKGGVLLWQKESGGKLPKPQNHFANRDFRYVEGNPDPQWLAKFPNRQDLPDLVIPQATPFDVPPVVLGIALVPPNENLP